MPYIQTGSPQRRTGNPGIRDVYHSPNVFANNVAIALWQAPADTAAFVLAMQSPENTFLLEQTDVDSIDSTSTATWASTVQGNVDAGISSGVLNSPASQAATTVGPADTSGPATTATSILVGGNWDQYNQDNIPYATLMLTPKTSLATFTTKSTLWVNQPTPFGPNAVQPGKGDNKHLKEQDIYVKGKGVIGRITVPQILHNLSNLAANVWEPFKEKFPQATVTNTFRQNAPGGSSNQAQHGTGMAMDIQLPGATPEKYLEAVIWLRDNVPFDQLLQEKAGTSRWIHISHYSGFGYQVPAGSKVANCIVSPEYSFVPGLSLLA